MFSAVSQILINYRDSQISKGKVGHIHGGDLLPWAPAPDADNFDTFRTIGWQLHVYGAPRAELGDWCKSNNLRLCVFPWQEAYEKSALSQDAMYLLRPDTYVALAAQQQDPDILSGYFLGLAICLNSTQ